MGGEGITALELDWRRKANGGKSRANGTPEVPSFINRSALGGQHRIPEERDHCWLFGGW